MADDKQTSLPEYCEKDKPKHDGIGNMNENQTVDLSSSSEDTINAHVESETPPLDATFTIAVHPMVTEDNAGHEIIGDGVDVLENPNEPPEKSPMQQLFENYIFVGRRLLEIKHSLLSLLNRLNVFYYQRRDKEE